MPAALGGACRQHLQHIKKRKLRRWCLRRKPGLCSRNGKRKSPHVCSGGLHVRCSAPLLQDRPEPTDMSRLKASYTRLATSFKLGAPRRSHRSPVSTLTLAVNCLPLLLPCQRKVDLGRCVLIPVGFEPSGFCCFRISSRGIATLPFSFIEFGSVPRRLRGEWSVPRCKPRLERASSRLQNCRNGCTCIIEVISGIRPATRHQRPLALLEL